MSQEIWIAIKGQEGRYEVSSMGRVRSIERITQQGNRKVRNRGRVLIARYSTTRYLCVSIPGISKSARIHRLVAENFIPRVEGKNVVNHIDGDRANNSVCNLEWCTQKENNQHSWHVLGNHNLKPRRGKDSASSKPVVHMDSAGAVVGEYYSIKEAERLTAIPKHQIGFILKGKRLDWKGSTFRYA